MTDLVDAATRDTIDEVRGWATDLWEGRSPDVEELRDRVLAVLLIGVISGGTAKENELYAFASSETLRYLTEPVGLLKRSSRSRAIFIELIQFLMERSPVLGVVSREELEEDLRQTAFFVTGVLANRLVRKVKSDLIRARIEGWSQRQFIEAVSKTTDRSAAQIETVFRTNVASAASAGRFVQYTKSPAANLYYGYRYVSKQDHRSRPTHRMMNGFVAVKDDPIWSTIWTPNGFNCRCVIRPLRKAQAVRLGLINEDGAVLQRRIYRNEQQRAVVSMADNGSSMFIGGKEHYFPDQGFRGNMLIGKVA